MVEAADGIRTEYTHTQKAPLCLLVYALAAVFLALGWFVQDAPPIPWLFPPIGLLMLLVAASFHHLTVRDLAASISQKSSPTTRQPYRRNFSSLAYFWNRPPQKFFSPRSIKKRSHGRGGGG